MIDKRTYLFVVSFLFLVVGCSQNQREQKNDLSYDNPIALTNENKQKELQLIGKQWPEATGILSELKEESTYYYEGYNFDFGETLPKENYIKIERNIGTNIAHVKLEFPIIQEGNEQIDIALTYNIDTREISNLETNKKNLDTSGISRQLSMIFNMVDSN